MQGIVHELLVTFEDNVPVVKINGEKMDLRIKQLDIHMGLDSKYIRFDTKKEMVLCPKGSK